MTRVAPYLTLVVVTLLAGPPAASGVCGDGVVDPGEDCDDGGHCVGGANAGTACTSEAECLGDGGCLGGAHDLWGCRDDDDCPEGRCVHCRPAGGDGCASNCTAESHIATTLVEGVACEPPDCGVFWVLPGTSAIVIYGPFLTVPLPLTGRQALTVGRQVTGMIPLVVREAALQIDRIPVSTIACACVRSVAAMTCGGTLFDFQGNQSANCSPDFPGARPCPEGLACAPVFGPGNAASGFIECGGAGYDLETEQDCGGPGEAPRSPVVHVIRNPEKPKPNDGAALITMAAGIGTIVGLCSGTDPGYGPDGQFCTEDDAFGSRGVPSMLSLTTGMAVGSLLTDVIFEPPNPMQTRGEPFTCAGDTLALPIEATLATVVTSCDQPTVNDIAMNVDFVLESQLCVGDCDGDGEATVDELMRMVNVGLGMQKLSACAAADADADGRSTVDELVSAVGNALEGCEGE